MQSALQITFRHMEPSPALQARVREHLERLERFHERITACHVVIDAPPVHRRQGAPFDVKIHLSVPGEVIDVCSEHAEHDAHTDVYVAVRDAFDSAKRRLQDHERVRRDTRAHSDV